MYITRRNGATFEGVIVSKTGSTIRAAVQGADATASPQVLRAQFARQSS